MDRIHSGSTDNNVAYRLTSFDKIVSDNEKNKSANNVIVTELTAYHLTGLNQTCYILDQIQTTNSISKFEILTDQIEEQLRKMQNELREERDLSFVIYNEDTADINGMLVDNIDINDLNFYIKDLVSYYDLIRRLKETLKEKTAKFYSLKDDRYQSLHDIKDAILIFLDNAFSRNSGRFFHSPGLYADLFAVHNLIWEYSG